MSTTTNGKIPEQTPTVEQSRIKLTECSDIPKARSRRRSSQSKTSYQLAHPPPTNRQRQRFRLRPKTLLQIQLVSNASRPIPLFDVLPSILFAPRLSWRVPRILQNKQGLGLDDLVVVRSQSRTSFPPAVEGQPWNADRDERTEREVVAAICQLSVADRNGRHRTEIRYSQGAIWTATALRSGAYEFVSHGQGDIASIARWVPKREHPIPHGTATPERSDFAGSKFKFSLIDAKSRQHPVIANMSRQSIEIYDRYSIPCSPQATPRQANAASFEQVGSVDRVEVQHGECDKPCKTIIETDDELRTVIAVTGIWVAFCEQWSPNFRYSTKQVISNGISELSSRRRSDTVQSLALSADESSQDRSGVGNVFRHWPRPKHNPCLSSIPSSPLSASPAPSPQRTTSTSTTIFGEHGSVHGASFEAKRPLTGTKIDTVPSNPEESLGRRGSVLPRGTVGRKGEESLGNSGVLARGSGNRPGTLQRVVARLRRTRSDR
ncbi:MAG: hypothetical protein Q9213_007720 [Squamulea squamosa]